MTDFPAITRKRASELMVDVIKDKIENGEFPPEHKLPSEKELSQIFAVSRSTVREALSNLAAIGIIEIRQGEGSFVKQISPSELVDPLIFKLLSKEKESLGLLEARYYIELGTVQLAALRATEHDLMEMSIAIQKFEDSLNSGDDGVEGDFEFHMAIAKAARNPFLTRLMDNLSTIMKETLRFTLSQNTGHLKKRRQTVLNEHKEIYSAICAKNPALAAEKMGDHLENVRKKLLANQKIL